MAVDLHTHSNKSDGSSTPTELIRSAARSGLSCVALTDHDNLDGIEEARTAADEEGIDLIAGTELSVDWQGAAMHMLVYFLEPGEGPLQNKLAWLQRSRSTRNERIIDKLQGLGIDISLEEVVEAADGTGVGRPHFAKVLIHKGVVTDFKDAFDRLLATGRPAYVNRNRLEARDAISLARQSGAVPVIAHPHTVGVGREDYEKAFDDLADVGLGGVECWYAEYTPELREHLAATIMARGLVPTGGSDYHGTFKPEISLGTGKGDLVVPDHVADDLRNAII